jgi:capsular polysaccharide transport system permease protein
MEALTLTRDTATFPGASAGAYAGVAGDTLLRFLRRHLGLLLVVVLPTVMAGLYLFAMAANQYESAADFTVKSAAQPNASSSSGLAQMFGLSGATSSSQSDSFSVSDYLSSHDAVAALQHRVDLVAIFRRPGADPVAALWFAHPTAEQLLQYYRRQVKVAYNPETGITTLKVHAFRRADAQAIAEILLELGEQRVNLLNARVFENSLSVARQQLREAEASLVASQGGLTAFRQSERDIDPDRSSTAQISLLTGLEQELAQARAQLSALGAAVRTDSPQYVAMQQRVQGLNAQVATQSARLTGGGRAMAPGLGAYEGLRLRQDFASKRYESSAAAVESAREQAAKQQLYVVRIVEPNLPEKALYPQRWIVLTTVLCGALLIYGIGWLLLAGVREHAI